MPKKGKEGGNKQATFERRDAKKRKTMNSQNRMVMLRPSNTINKPRLPAKTLNMKRHIGLAAELIAKKKKGGGSKDRLKQGYVLGRLKKKKESGYEGMPRKKRTIRGGKEN